MKEKLKMTDIMTSVVEKIKEEIFINPTYSVDEISWYVQDCINFPKKKREDFLLSKSVLDVLGKIKFEWSAKETAIRFSCYFLQNMDLFESLYEELADDSSRMILEWLIKGYLAHMVCGDVYKKIFNLPKQVDSIKKEQLIPNYQHLYYIDKYCIYALEQEIYDTWIREQYLLRGICEPNKGDVVFSIGAFYGETSIWFSKYVGKEGTVYAFEALGENARVAECNCRRNSINNIIVENICFWKETTLLNFNIDYGSSRITDNDTGVKVNTTTIDEYCTNNKINKLDFLKMDIEGAEYEVLCGAKQTIKKYKPKLAICVYHKPEDIILIPQLIKELVPEYKIYLSHRREDFIETVLFATV